MLLVCIVWCSSLSSSSSYCCQVQGHRKDDPSLSGQNGAANYLHMSVIHQLFILRTIQFLILCTNMVSSKSVCVGGGRGGH